jgi:deoxyribodipyrimidine photo-lyase
MSHFSVPTQRLRSLNDRPVSEKGDYVLYWMTAFRRSKWNFALQHARDWALHLQRPLVVVEAVKTDYPWACDRFHRFIIEGMRDNLEAFEKSRITYFPYVEPQKRAGKGLIEQLAATACLLVSDDFPCFFHPGMYQKLAGRLSCKFELVDANCLMPLAAADRTFTVAHSYRRWMQKELPKHLENSPEPNPLAANKLKCLPQLTSLLPLKRQFLPADLGQLLTPTGLSQLPIDHSVLPIEQTGGAKAAEKLLNRFIQNRLQKYDHDRNEPDRQGSSELSGHLHFGQISTHQVFWEVMEQQLWNLGMLAKPNGKVNGFWGVEANTEAFLDQLCTWREIGFNMCWRETNYDKYESLPDWARQSLAKHTADKRTSLYTLEQLDRATTHDPIWNAAQRQLILEGRIHNYLRMLWGKKILQWSPSPQTALEWMIELNNKYAIDGRDPNSYSGIFWVLGRYDRAWGPEREVFGKIRYMTSENTAKKHPLTGYLKQYGRFPTNA